MARRKSLAGSNTSRARIPLPVHEFDIRAQHAGEAADTRRRLWRPSETAPTSPVIALASETPPVASMSMCRRRHIRISTCMGDASPTPRGTCHGICARRTFALITFLSVTDIYTYIDAPAAHLVASFPARQLKSNDYTQN